MFWFIVYPGCGTRVPCGQILETKQEPPGSYFMSEIYDIIIIGGGPAGLSAGIYACRSGYKTLLLEKTGYGGQMNIISDIDNYPGFADGVTGAELWDRMMNQAKKFKLETKIDKVNKIVKDKQAITLETYEGSYQAHSVIIASGARHRTLKIAGEGKLTGKGVSYCGVCDGFFFRGKEIVVIGGGDSALTEALYLAKFASKVTIIHRRDRFRAVDSIVKLAEKEPKISFLFNRSPVSINGEESVESITLRDVETDETSDMPIEGVFVFVGLVPNSDFIDPELMDDDSHVITDITMATKESGVYAAGDIRSGAFRQIICACSDGATAASYAGAYVDEKKGTAY
jgi:thioredoxin reductase (NADPH)